MTDKLVLRTVEQFLADFRPTYNPMYPLFLANGVQYDTTVGTQNLRRLNAMGDIRAKHITPKDTEIKQIGSAESLKTYKKFYLMNQYVESSFQDQRGQEEVISQALDEHQKQADEILLGDGINSGIYTSTDSNYLTESSKEVAVADSSHLPDLYAKVLAEAAIADDLDGRKLLIFYGSTVAAKYSGLFVNAARSFSSVLADGLPSYEIMQMPTAVTPNGANGFLIINMDQIKLHWTLLPQLKSQGFNEEKEYYWFNFALGSMMVDVKTQNGIIKQPLTFA